MIDTDLGVSGRWGVAREGARRAGRQGLRRRGAIFGIEICRLAGSNGEVARLMEFADGIYDPRDVNDRILRGMKSAIGEAELHVMATACAMPSGPLPPAASCAPPAGRLSPRRRRRYRD